VDEGGDDEARADAQRGENLGERCPNERFDFSDTRSVPTVIKEREAISRRKSIREKCQARDAEGQRSVGARQHEAWKEVRDQLNSLLSDWAGYFCYGSRGRAYKSVDHHVCEASDASSSGDIRYQTAERSGSPRK